MARLRGIACRMAHGLEQKARGIRPVSAVLIGYKIDIYSCGTVTPILIHHPYPTHRLTIPSYPMPESIPDGKTATMDLFFVQDTRKPANEFTREFPSRWPTNRTFRLRFVFSLWRTTVLLPHSKMNRLVAHVRILFVFRAPYLPAVGRCGHHGPMADDSIEPGRSGFHPFVPSCLRGYSQRAGNTSFAFITLEACTPHRQTISAPGK